MTAGEELNLVRAFQRSVAFLHQLRIPYAVVGARALAVWGCPRPTDDLDFMVMVDPPELGHLSARFVEVGMWNVRYRQHYVRLMYGKVPIDLLRPLDPHDGAMFRRRQRVHTHGCSCWVVGPEDYVIQKVKVGRDKDLNDALSVVHKTGPQLDRGYLYRWARQLGAMRALSYVLGIGEHPGRAALSRTRMNGRRAKPNEAPAPAAAAAPAS